MSTRNLDMVKRALLEQGYEEASLGVSGLRVVSTFDATAQVAAVNAVAKACARRRY